MDTSYWKEIDAHFGRGARVASKQEEKKVKLVERESEDKGKRKWKSKKKENKEKEIEKKIENNEKGRMKAMDTSYCKEIDAQLGGEQGLPQNKRKGKVKRKTGSGDGHFLMIGN